MRKLEVIGILSILLVSLIGCYSVKYVQSEVPDLELTPITAPSIPEDSESWSNQEFVDMVNYSLKLEIQLDAYRKYVQSLSKV